MDRVLNVISLAVLLGGIATLLHGCGDPLADQARAATVTAGVLSAGGEAADLARDAALDRVEAAHPNDPEHDVELEREAAKWRPVGIALDEARTALRAWVDALELARIAGGGEDLLGSVARVATRAVQLVLGALDLARELDVDVPEVPPIVRAVLAGVGGR